MTWYYDTVIHMGMCRHSIRCVQYDSCKTHSSTESKYSPDMMLFTNLFAQFGLGDAFWWRHAHCDAHCNCPRVCMCKRHLNNNYTIPTWSKLLQCSHWTRWARLTRTSGIPGRPRRSKVPRWSKWSNSWSPWPRGPSGTGFTPWPSRSTWALQKVSHKLWDPLCCVVLCCVVVATNHVIPTSSRASIRNAVRRLTARSREVSKPQDSGLDFSNRSKIWQAPQQQRCWDACHISDHYNIQSRASRLHEIWWWNVSPGEQRPRVTSATLGIVLFPQCQWSKPAKYE